MGHFRFSRILIPAAALLLLSFVPVQAQPGDCNFDGVANATDLTYLVSYLFAAGPVPDLVDCDCDGFPGVNYGDLWQLTQGLFAGATLYPSPGTDYPIPSGVKFLALGQPDGTTITTASIVVDAPQSVDCLVLMYSFAPGPGQATLNCTGVNFTGSVATGLTAVIDNTGKTITIHSSGTNTLPTTPNWRLFATANFALAGAPGTGVTLTPVSVAPNWPMLLAQAAYAGTNGIRVMIPTFVPISLMNVGDVNCDGQVDIDDVVYLINFIFGGGPPPGDPNNDGIPDC